MVVRKQFARYVSQDILGMMGMSFYILADTFFIALAEGADGITALNLVLPLYSIIYAIGAMIGVGSAIRFKIAQAKGDKGTDTYFSNAMIFALLIGLCFMVVGWFGAEALIGLLGGDERIVMVGASYTRIFMMFAPCFMWNHICNSFVRNDGAPSIAMAATLFSSLFNIVMDYVLMFPLGLGMAGAALATAISPIIGILICCVHFFSKKSTIRLHLIRPSVSKLLRSCQLGLSAFIGEISSGVTTVVFNMLILSLAGNVGVAAYGVVANTSLVAVSVFNGVSQGVQPLVSEYYGKGARKEVKTLLCLALITSLVLAVVIFAFAAFFAEEIVDIFNSEHDAALASYGVAGMRLYFTGFLFAGINIVGTGFLSAVEEAKKAFAASVLRGFAAIIFCAVLLAKLFGMTGVWLAFPAAELITVIVTGTALYQNIRKEHGQPLKASL